MKDNMGNFKEIADLVLKDINASDELKRKTLERCTVEKGFKAKPAMASATAALFILIGLYSYHTRQPLIAVNTQIGNEIKNESFDLPTVPETAANNTEPSIGNSVKKPDNQSLNMAKQDTAAKSASDNLQTMDSTLKAAEDSSQVEIADSGSNISTSGRQYGISSFIKPLTITDAEKYFGSAILIPSNIPEGFRFTSITIPNEGQKCVKLSYSSKTAYFDILESKNPNEPAGTKVINISNKKAYISYSMDESQNIISKITWIKAGIQYTLTGNISESLLVNTAISMMN